MLARVHPWLVLLVAGVSGLFASPRLPAADPVESLAILPASIRLSGPEARQLLVLERMADGRYRGEVGDPQWTSSNAEVVTVDGQTLVPRRNGRAVVTARTADQSATVAVEVVGMETPHRWSFRNHVTSVFSKTGCNSGACHGALAGKGGLKLSLRGYNTHADYQALTRQALGRRVELADPGRSLILAKPSGAIPHKGGLRFDVDSREYRVIADWIAQGTPPPQEQDPRLERLEILPAATVQAIDATQQLLVRAYFSDGHQEDVTQWAKYTATNETVAKVDERGRVTITGHGEAAITAWYLSQIVIARVTAPYPNRVAPVASVAMPPRNFIDALVVKKLQELNLPPSAPAREEVFLRRAFLDTIGVLPTSDEARRFLADRRGDKRDRLIEDLLARPEFVDYWTYKWSDLLLVSGRRLRPQAVNAYYDWIRRSVAENKPWDRLAREIVTATGSSYDNGATNFFALHQDPLEMAENTAVAFLGLNINCARCHNHPLEKWTNDQYYAMANLFARVRAKGWGGDPRGGDGLRTVYVVDEGELIQPLSGRPQPPTPLDGEPIAFDAPGDRRLHLATWLTSTENPYFSRAIANRVWANFLGTGIVEPIDDLRVSNPASNDELLAALAEYLVDQGYDLKALMREILRSNTYQTGSTALAANRADERYYSHYYPRRLMAEVLLDAICQVTGVSSTFNKRLMDGADVENIADYPAGTRALQLKDSAVASPFLKTFGRNERMITCECERSDEPSMVQVLHISNGDTINGKLQEAGNRLGQLIGAGLDNQQIIEEAYLACLARYPTADETKSLLELLGSADAAQRRLALEDLYWGILSSREFLFQH